MRLFPTALAGLLLTTALAASAQDPEPQVSAGEMYWEQARELYGDREYTLAIPLIRQAIQADPGDARYYRGLARAAHFAEDYETAVYYYDIYLAYFADHAAAERSRSNRTEAIQGERDRANGNRTTPEQPPGPTDMQAAALEAVESRIATGPLMSADGTGAYSLYQGLMRTGYAHPHLIQVRQQLREGIFAETHAMFWPNQDSPVPVATYQQWRHVNRRYEAVAALGGATMADAEVEARLAAAQGQIDLINANYREALERFGTATRLDPNLGLSYWGLLRAQHGLSANLGEPMPTEALTWLARLEELTRIQAPQHTPLLAVGRAMILHDGGAPEAAAAALLELLAPGHDSGVVMPDLTPPAPPEPPPVELVPGDPAEIQVIPTPVQ